MKKCNTCKIIKPVDQYYRDTRSSDGLYTSCKSCHNSRVVHWQKNNNEKTNKAKKDFENKYKKKYGLSYRTMRRNGFRTSIQVYEKANKKCHKCGSEYDLTIHHRDNKGRNYIESNKEPNNKISNLMVLCRPCHGRLHSREYWDAWHQKRAS